MLAKSFWDLKKKQAEDTLNSKDHKNKANHSMVIKKNNGSSMITQIDHDQEFNCTMRKVNH